MAKRFEKALEVATEQTLVEPNWEGILECVDMIRGADVPVKEAIALIQKRYHNSNPHVVHHTLLVLEACVKNCGKKFHVEIATKEFMDDLKNLVIAGAVDKVNDKILELIQCWSSAFRDKPEYEIVCDTHNMLKMSGFVFPVMKEADAMFIADSAPDWVEGTSCYRCRSEFGVFTRKHHCRACGQIFCDKCSNKQMLLPQFGIEKKVRVCETCFDRKTNAITKSVSSSSKEDETKERARLQELIDKETEELQLALAISQSEAEAKQQERYSRNYPSFTNAETNQEVAEIYKGAANTVEESTPLKIDNEEPVLDSVLAKYLDRDYWERKRLGKEEENLGPLATAPPPSEISVSVSSNTSQFIPNDSRFDLRAADTSTLNSFDKLQLNKSDNDEVAETSDFCKALKEQVDTMDNRMRSNLLRGRSIVNDSAIHSLFAQLTNSHANVLGRMTKLENDREYYESLQDHLAHIQEARQAVNALRDEHTKQKEARLLEEQQLRRVAMQQKLELMRQKKHEMLVFQRHMALQRFQEQELQIQQRRIFQQQQQQQLGLANSTGQVSIPGMIGQINYYPNGQPQIAPNEIYQPPSVTNGNAQQQTLSYGQNSYSSPVSQSYYGMIQNQQGNSISNPKDHQFVPSNGTLEYAQQTQTQQQVQHQNNSQHVYNNQMYAAHSLASQIHYDQPFQQQHIHNQGYYVPQHNVQQPQNHTHLNQTQAPQQLYQQQPIQPHQPIQQQPIQPHQPIQQQPIQPHQPIQQQPIQPHQPIQQQPQSIQQQPQPQSTQQQPQLQSTQPQPIQQQQNTTEDLLISFD